MIQQASPPPPKKRHHGDTVNLRNQTNRSIGCTDATAATEQLTVPPTAEADALMQPITADGIRPQKRFYRQRAHCNPLAHNDSYDYPVSPYKMDWTSGSNLYPGVVDGDVTTNATQARNESAEKEHRSHSQSQQPTVLDIGCGFGGLTLALASLLPHENICGMEIRAKVTEYVRLRIVAARLERSYCINPHAIEHSIPPPPPQTTIATTNENTSTSTMSLPAIPKSSVESKSSEVSSLETATTAAVPSSQQQQHHYNNCGVIRTNSMKYLPNYFLPHTISKLFFCFPDPHFKRKNFPRRIVSYRLLDEYAYVLRQQGQQKPFDLPKSDKILCADETMNMGNKGSSAGKLYAITDVKELHDWHVNACNTHPLFVPLLISESSSLSTSSSNRKNIPNKDDDDNDPFIYAMKYLTEEGQKVDRNHGSKYYIIYECRHRPTFNDDDDDKNVSPPPIVHAGNFFLN
jgi:tRNA (guanine-N7-)-methyltransferase